MSPDDVFFYVHSHRLLAASNNGFNRLLPVSAFKRESDSDPVLHIQETSVVANILLHTIYGMSCLHYCPTIQDLASAVSALQKYGISLDSHIAPSSPLFVTILSHASTSPLEIYALAANNGIHDLAVAVSPHLLSLPLSSLTDDAAAQIGPVYLKRLFFLHLGRIEALKRLLLPPPEMHDPTPICDFEQQKKLTRAWALAASYLTWDAKPDMQAAAMESALISLGDHLSCHLCKKALSERVHSLVVQWGAIKVCNLFSSILLKLTSSVENDMIVVLCLSSLQSIRK